MRCFALLSVLLLLSLPASVASAGLLLSYESGVAGAVGQAGAADPTSQGWSVNTAGSAPDYSLGQDSGMGGWRITDGTSRDHYFYQRDLTSSQASLMQSQDWAANWTVGVNADAVGRPDIGTVNDYYSAVPGRQNNNVLWIEVANEYLYVLSYESDQAGNVFLNDGTNRFQITTGGNALSQDVGNQSPSVHFVDYELRYDSQSGLASLTDSLGGEHGVVARSGNGATNRVVWGASSSAGQGSTTWNQLAINTVPEPSSALIFVMASAGSLFLRRRRA